MAQRVSVECIDQLEHLSKVEVRRLGTMVNNTTVSGTIIGLNSSNPTVPVMRVGTNQNVSTQT